MAKIKIQSITATFYTWLEWEKTFSWIFDENKKINVFFLPNGGWKTIIYEAMNDMLSWKQRQNIEKEYTWDYEIVINCTIGEENIEIKKNISWLSYKKWEKTISSSDYQAILKKELNISEDLINYTYKDWERKEIRKNTVNSIFRYNFFSKHDMPNKNNKRIPLINNTYDKNSKKVLLSYFLWSDYSQEDFAKFCDFSQMNNFIKDNKKKVQKYDNVSNIFNNNGEELYKEYSGVKQKFGDISIAIEKLEELVELAKSNFWEENSDYIFINSQLDALRSIKKKLTENRKNLKEEIQKLNDYEKDALIKQSDKWIIETIKKFKQFENNVKQMDDEIKIIEKNISQKITPLFEFIQNWFQRNNTLSNYWAKFDVDQQEFYFTKPWNESYRITLRIIGSVLLNIFSNKNWWRIPDYIFYDSIFEDFSENNWKAQFDLINNLYNKIEFKEYLPQLFIFIAWDHDRYGLTDLNNISIKEISFLSRN